MTIDGYRYTVTDAEIALVNLRNARSRSWGRFMRDPKRAGSAERIVEEEQFTLQFTGDITNSRATRGTRGGTRAMRSGFGAHGAGPSSDRIDRAPFH
ncbi:MAG: hypothetical protein QM744_16300 [Mesorhizobium sp.]